MGDLSVWMHSVSLEMGKKCNVEVQRSNKDSPFKKSAVQCIGHHGCGTPQTDDKFEETIDLIVVYISEFDIFKCGRVIYHVGQRDPGNTGKSRRRIGACIRQLPQ